jgi:hypothetical protein
MFKEYCKEDYIFVDKEGNEYISEPETDIANFVVSSAIIAFTSPVFIAVMMKLAFLLN